MYKEYNTLVEFCTNCIEIPKLLLAGIKTTSVHGYICVLAKTKITKRGRAYFELPPALQFSLSKDVMPVTTLLSSILPIERMKQ